MTSGRRRKLGLLACGFWLVVWTGASRAASLPAVEAKSAMVVTAQALATRVGVDVLRAGGNAVDAAVAIGYAEAVVNPCCGNLGGGGFMVLRMADRREAFLDFRETAPAAATARMYLGADGKPVPGASLYGWRAVAVPGTVAGLDAALLRYGTMSRGQVMAPAIALARDGFVLTPPDIDILRIRSKRFATDTPSARVFLHPDLTPLAAGERLVQADLAATLRAIAERGPEAFYAGPVAQALAQASRAGGGVLTEADLAAYRVSEGLPLHCTYRGRVILSAPPPSSGGATLCEILGVLSGYDLGALGFHSAAATHLVAEAMRHAFLDRNMYLGDPGFVNNPLGWMLSPAHEAAIRTAIGPRATPSDTLHPGVGPHEQAETTAYAVVDAAGDAVSVTYTLNGYFGAGVMAPGTGFEMNDEMDDFSIAPDVPNMFGLVQGIRNAIAPGKRPLSSMAPTIVLEDGELAYVLGSPGGSRIITIVGEVLMNLIDYGMRPQEAVDATRLHAQWLPDVLYAEPFALSADTQAILRAQGYTIERQAAWGDATLIVIAHPSETARAASATDDSEHGHAPSQGMRLGASDPRRPAGAAMGY